MKHLRLLLLALTLFAVGGCGESGITQPTTTAPSWDVTDPPPPPPPPDPTQGSGG